MKFKIIPLLFTITLVSISGIPLESAFADDASGELFYTRFTDTSRVEKVNFDFTGGVFSLTIPVSVSGGHGADGIVFNPNDANSILVADQGAGAAGDVLRIDRNHLGANPGGIIQTANVGVNSFHLAVVGSSLYVAGIPSTPARVVLNGDGTIGASTILAPVLGSSDTTVTQIIDTPANGLFYTRSGPGGNGNFGTITFPGLATFQTTALFPHPATHGGEYDPFTTHIMIFGDSFMAQIDPATGLIVSSRDFTGVCAGDPNPQFDQGTIDAKGHAFVADNNGNLFFIDYSGSTLIGDAGNFVACPFLAANLDDIASILDSEIVGGSILPIDTVALLVAGIQSMTIWIAPVLAGAAGTAAFYLKTRKN